MIVHQAHISEALHRAFFSDGKLNEKLIYLRPCLTWGKIHSERIDKEGGGTMENVLSLLEGTGSGRMNRVVMGKLRWDIDLLEGIRELAKKEGVRAGIILSAVGALRKAIFRNLKVLPADLKIERHHRLYLELEQPMEIVSLTGWMAAREDGEIEVHAHLSASTVVEDQVTTLGGHLTSGIITSVKVVVVIGVIEESNIRAGLDPRTNQIDVKFSF
jgi:predicted DNA-binding protein with PD1-like motif